MQYWSDVFFSFKKLFKNENKKYDHVTRLLWNTIQFEVDNVRFQ